MPESKNGALERAPLVRFSKENAEENAAYVGFFSLAERNFFSPFSITTFW